MTDPEKLIWEWLLIQTDRAINKGGYEAFLSWLVPQLPSRG